ncbi:hypothetical protein SeMB42_g05758 [Synchytrium endobioticum]|uniref:Secreted protein n=1 Tax=Synchytrium endobioticum TaxID=286115 RepID=A0A507CPM8_9FUNG|nr:hypothetical protein SeMB42_g05758 [Synchytrium endobioticum]TPX46030.1 hypothetical protein SeLEV6574_g03490 [Synchytrium endobioticum]
MHRVATILFLALCALCCIFNTDGQTVRSKSQNHGLAKRAENGGSPRLDDGERALASSTPGSGRRHWMRRCRSSLYSLVSKVFRKAKNGHAYVRDPTVVSVDMRQGVAPSYSAEDFSPHRHAVSSAPDHVCRRGRAPQRLAIIPEASEADEDSACPFAHGGSRSFAYGRCSKCPESRLPRSGCMPHTERRTLSDCLQTLNAPRRNGQSQYMQS